MMESIDDIVAEMRKDIPRVFEDLDDERDA
jgi:hypothetical protein